MRIARVCVFAADSVVLGVGVVVVGTVTVMMCVTTLLSVRTQQQPTLLLEDFLRLPFVRRG